MIDTLDLPLRVSNEGSQYRVHAEQSIAFTRPPLQFRPATEYIPISEIEPDLHRLSPPRMLRLGNEEEARRIGVALFQILFRGQIRASYYACRAFGREVHWPVRLLLDLPSELARLPWELLYDPSRSEFLFDATDLRVTRLHEPDPLALLGRPREPLIRWDSPGLTSPFRTFLIVIPGDPAQLPPDARLDLEQLVQAFDRLKAAYQVDVRYVRGSAWQAELKQYLSVGCDAIHLMCHANLHHQDMELLTNAISSIPSHYPTQRFVFLDASASGDDVMALALRVLVQSRSRRGPQAVASMQSGLQADIAADLAYEVYSRLCRGTTVDTALSEARRWVARSHGNPFISAMTPLYVRTEAWAVPPAQPAASLDVAPEAPELCARFDGLERDEALTVGQRTPLVVWLERSAALARQAQTTHHALHESMRFRVHLDVDPACWAVQPVEPTLIIDQDGKTAQEALFLIRALQPVNDQFHVCLELVDRQAVIQHLWVRAVARTAPDERSPRQASTSAPNQ